MNLKSGTICNKCLRNFVIIYIKKKLFPLLKHILSSMLQHAIGCVLKFRLIWDLKTSVYNI